MQNSAIIEFFIRFEQRTFQDSAQIPLSSSFGTRKVGLAISVRGLRTFVRTLFEKFSVFCAVSRLVVSCGHAASLSGERNLYIFDARTVWPELRIAF